MTPTVRNILTTYIYYHTSTLHLSDGTRIVCETSLYTYTSFTSCVEKGPRIHVDIPPAQAKAWDITYRYIKKAKYKNAGGWKTDEPISGKLGKLTISEDEVDLDGHKVQIRTKTSKGRWVDSKTYVEGEPRTTRYVEEAIWIAVQVKSGLIGRKASGEPKDE